MTKAKVTTEANAKRWWERPLGIVALGVVVVVLGDLVLGPIHKHTLATATQSQPQLQPAQQAPTSTPAITPPSQAAPPKKRKSPPQHASARTSGPSSPAVGSIQQGPGSALSIGQQGGITAGTINVALVDVVYNYDGSIKKTARAGSVIAVASDPNATVVKIRSELTAGQDQEALSDAQGLMTSDPLWATPHVLAGLCYVNLGNQEAAKTELQKSRSLVPAGYEYEQDYTPHLRNLEEAIKRHEPKPS
jgi:hypothetical protein